MQRRQFLSLASLAAIATALIGSTKLGGRGYEQWQLDGVGSLARIGVLTPDDDPVPESELWTMAPRGVSIHAARVEWNHDAAAFAQPPKVDDATEQLVRHKHSPDVTLLSRTSILKRGEARKTATVKLQRSTIETSFAHASSA